MPTPRSPLPTAAELLTAATPGQIEDQAQHPDGLLHLVQVMCREIVQSRRTVQGAAVAVQLRGSPFTVAHTAPWVQTLIDSEYQHRTGPGLHALRTRKVVTATRGDLLARWPAPAEPAADAGVRAVHAEPLPIPGQPGGVLTLYSTDFDLIDLPPGRLTPVRELLTAALTSYCDTHPHENHAIRLQRQLQQRQIQGQAIGILMVRHGVSETRARQILQNQASAGQVTEITAARALIREQRRQAP